MGLLILLTGIVAAASYITFRNITAINTSLVKYSEITIPSLEILSHLDSDIKRLRYIEAEHVFKHPSAVGRRKDRIIAEITAEIEAHIITYNRLMNSGEKHAIFDTFEAKWREYIDLHYNVMRFILEKSDDKAIAVFEGEMGAIIVEITSILERALTGERENASAQKTTAAGEYAAIQLSLLVSLSLTLVFCVSATAYAVFGVLRPLVDLSGAMQRLADGRFDVYLPRLGPKNEIGAIARAVERFKEKTAERALSLEQARAAAEAGAKAKANFIASMSHEIRTPLNGVLGMAQALRANDPRDDQREQIDIILDSGSTLMALLNDVLDLSKIDAEKMEIVPIDDDLRGNIARLVELFRPGADDKGVSLNLMFDAALPARLKFDPVRVRQCVSNLLSNAIKFTSRGQIGIRVMCAPEGPGLHLVRIEISDTGIGMTRDTLGKLFLAFNQADSSISRRFGGSGLGLAISRRLTQAMGGDIEVRSEFGSGSCFTMRFVAADAAASPVAAQITETISEALPPPAVVLQGMRILLVDDNTVNRQVIKLFLKPFQTLISEAANGEDALAALKAAPFDLVLLDVHMPVMDGMEAIKAIRASTAGWSDIPAIALTADAMIGDRERYIGLGMTDYLAKPIDGRELISKIVHVMAQLARASDPIDAPEPVVDRAPQQSAGRRH
jgi:signal transduction histidine kinase/FixJ family two-component response regulator